MTCINRIECLPQDVVREIMFRVAGQPDGAADIARTVAVSKSFQDFVTNGDLLRAVSFKGLLSCLDGRYELLSELDGLVVRSSRAGNSDALFILSKVVMVCASKRRKAETGATYSDAFQDQNSTISSGNGNLSDLDKAERLLDFSAQNMTPTTLNDLVRNFLVRAKFQDLVEMQDHLKDFVAMYHIHGIKPPYQQFHVTLDKLCKKKFPVIAPSMMKSAGLEPSVLVSKFNAFLISTHDKMKDMGFDEQLLSTLLECSVEINDDAVLPVYDTMIERLNMAKSILKQGSQVALLQQNSDVKLTIRDVLFLATILRIYFSFYKNRQAFHESARRSLLESFDALFCIQQGS